MKKRIKALKEISGFDQNIIKKFSKLGIDSAEELAALAVTQNGVQKISKFLGSDEHNVKKLIDSCRTNLPKELRVKLLKQSDLKVTFGARKPKRRKEFEAAMAKHLAEPPKRALSQFSSMISATPSITTPSDVNLIPKMTVIKNQHSRGTCVAFACVAVREFLAESKPDFSEQFLYWKCDELDDVPEEPGTTVENGFIALKTAGVCLEKTWLYNPISIPGNEGQGPPPANAKNEAEKYKLINMIDLDENSVQEFKMCLKGTDDVPGRPIAFGIPVYNSWRQSMAVQLSGQITMPLPDEEVVGGHAMTIVGYQDDSSVPGGGFFIIRNSWGVLWGTTCPYGAGYGTIPFKYITQYCWEAYTGDAKASDCFIATAAYGSPYAPEVQFLRNFRDNKLKSTSGGKAFVNFYEKIYYMFSPQIAKKMNQNTSIKNIFRWVVVAPIVSFLRKAVRLIELGNRRDRDNKKS